MMNWRSLTPTLVTGVLVAAIAIPLLSQSQDNGVINLLNEPNFVSEKLIISDIQTRDAAMKIGDIQSDSEGDFSQDTPARSVRISLNKVDHASFYQVQIIPFRRIWMNPMQFVATDRDPIIRLRLNPGQYQVRTRSLDERKMPGRWSNYQSFWIHFTPISGVYPKANSIVDAKSPTSEIITFEWPKNTASTYYLFSLKNHKGENLKLLLTKKNWLRENLSVNSQYYWSVFPVQSKVQALALLHQAEGLRYNRFSLIKSEERGKTLNVKVMNNPKAEKYQFEIVRVDKNNETSEPSIHESFRPGVELNLKPGEYELRARYVLKDKVPSEWSAPSGFFVARSTPKALLPEQNGSVESTDDLKSPTRFEWLQDPGADRYEFSLYSTDGTLIQHKVTQDSWIFVDLAAGQTYKWTVKALSPREKITTPPDRAPANATEFKVVEYTRLDLGVAEESSQFYGWARQISSLSKLKGANYDINSLVNQTMYSGETEAALGYWHRKSRLGLLGHAGSSGVIIQGQYYSYNHAGIHVGYRHFLANGARLRFWLGYAYNELPEVLTHPFTSDIEVKLLKSMGPEFRTAYFTELSDRLGLQLQASIYVATQDLGTPNGLQQKNRYTYKGSIYGSYTYSQLSKWLLGYTYNVEHGEYDTTDPIGIANSVDLTGHYLSLMYEFGLQEPMK